MSEPLWNFYDGEPWLDNPAGRLFIVGNPRRKRRAISKKKRGVKVMARRKRRSVRRTRRARISHAPRRRYVRARRRRSYRSNPVAFNPPRRRRSFRRKFRSLRRRRYSRNPVTLAGLNIQDMAYAAGAVLAAPFIERQIAPLLPASIAGTTTGRYAVKIGSAAVTWYAWKTLFGAKHANMAAIVLGANILGDAALEFMPSFTALSGVRGVRGVRGMGQSTARRVTALGNIGGGLGQSTADKVTSLAPFQSRFSPRRGTRMG